VRKPRVKEFAYLASDDLREHLRTVNIYTQLLLRRTDGQDANLNEYATFIRQGVGRRKAYPRSADLLPYRVYGQPAAGSGGSRRR
jgi:light-regulated signal transduction histidine kinase (bacteriophytochrome)